MQINFAEMVGTSRGMLAGGILASRAHHELGQELDALTPAIGTTLYAESGAGRQAIAVRNMVSDSLQTGSQTAISGVPFVCITQEAADGSQAALSGIPFVCISAEISEITH